MLKINNFEQDIFQDFLKFKGKADKLLLLLIRIGKNDCKFVSSFIYIDYSTFHVKVAVMTLDLGIRKNVLYVRYVNISATYLSRWC